MRLRLQLSDGYSATSELALRGVCLDLMADLLAERQCEAEAAYRGSLIPREPSTWWADEPNISLGSQS